MFARENSNTDPLRTLATLLLIAFLPRLNAQNTSQKPSGKARPSCQLTQADYAVYRALVDALAVPEYPENALQLKQILIADTTAAPRDVRSHFGTWGYHSKFNAAPRKDTVVDFERKAQSSCRLNSDFGDGKSHKVIAQAEMDKAFKGGGWGAFYKRYPQSGGYWIFSRPGYNAEGNEAVLAVSHWCGELCGTGHLYLLTKQNGQWTVQNRLMLWIS
jgi:hypothetical protein